MFLVGFFEQLVSNAPQIIFSERLKETAGKEVGGDIYKCEWKTQNCV